MKTLVDLSNERTLVVMSYEERKTGEKPKIEKRFFEVLQSRLLCAYNGASHHLPFAADGKAVYTQNCTS